MIGSSENRISYNGNGIATEFAYTFKILEKSNLKVLHIAADGTEELLTTDYYVDMEKSVVLYPGYAPGEEIPEQNRPPILPVGERLVIYREVPITQESALDKHWPFNVIEAGLDKLTIICQQIWDRLQRSLSISVSADKNVDTTFPYAPGKSIRWNDEGTGFEVMDNPELVLTECKAVRDEVISLKDTTEQYKNYANNYKDLAQEWAESTSSPGGNLGTKSSKSWANLSEAWAQSETSPDEQEGNKSSKSWAKQSYLWAESSSTPNGDINTKSSKSWAEMAESEANVAAHAANTAKALAAQAKVYDEATTYNPGDLVMTSDGSTYRCISESTGQNPIGSSNWVIVTFVEYYMFEYDENKDLMPVLSPKTSAFWEIDDEGNIIPIN